MIILRRHPCNEKPSVVADIGLRLQEGIQDLKLEQQLAPTREAISRTLNAGSTNFFKAVEGVRGRWARSASSTSVNESETSTLSTPVEISRSDADLKRDSDPPTASSSSTTQTEPTTPSTPSTSNIKPVLSSWGAGIGSFISTRAARFSMAPRAEPTPEVPPKAASPAPEPEPLDPEPPVTPRPGPPRSQLRSLSLFSKADPPAPPIVVSPSEGAPSRSGDEAPKPRSQLRTLTLKTDSSAPAVNTTRPSVDEHPHVESPVGDFVEPAGMAL